MKHRADAEDERIPELTRQVDMLIKANGRQTKRMCVIVILASACVGIGLVANEGTSERVRSLRFELVDKRGEVVGVIGTDIGLYPYLEIMSPGSQGSGGKVRLGIPAQGGPAVALSDCVGTERARMFLGGRLTEREVAGKATRFVTGQIPHILLFDEEHRIRGKFGSTSDSSALLEFRDIDGKVLFSSPK